MMYKKSIDAGYKVLMIWGGFAPLFFLGVCFAIWGWQEIVTDYFELLGISLLVSLPSTIAVWWINRNSQGEDFCAQTVRRVVKGLIFIGALNALLATVIGLIVAQLSLAISSLPLWVFIFFAIYFGGSALIAFGIIVILLFLLKSTSKRHDKV